MRTAFWNDRVRRLVPYIPGEQPKEAGLIKLNTNENPYPPSPLVIEAIKEAATERLRLYPDPACTALRSAIAERYGVDVPEVFAGNGSDEIIAFVFGAFFDTSAPVEFPDITYSFYPVYADLWGIPCREVPLREDLKEDLDDLKEDFTIDVDGYEASGGAIFPNPNAPTGIALPVREIERLALRCAAANRALVIDEAYEGFGAESAVPLIRKHSNLLTVHTLSKTASLAGLRAGFAIGSRPLIEALERVRDSFNSYTLDAVAQAAARAAILDRPYYEAVNRKVADTRERVIAALAERGFTTLPSSANFIFTKPPDADAAVLFRRLRERNILTRHFNRGRAACYLRVSIGSDADMDRFLAALD